MATLQGPAQQAWLHAQPSRHASGGQVGLEWGSSDFRVGLECPYMRPWLHFTQFLLLVGFGSANFTLRNRVGSGWQLIAQTSAYCKQRSCKVSFSPQFMAAQECWQWPGRAAPALGDLEGLWPTQKQGAGPLMRLELTLERRNVPRGKAHPTGQGDGRDRGRTSHDP